MLVTRPSYTVFLMRTASVIRAQLLQPVMIKMRRKYLNTITSAANGKNVLIFLVPSLAVYLVMLFYTIPSVQSFVPEMKVFDLMPAGYSHDYAVDLLSSLGASGRDVYLYTQLPLDFIYPALFSISSSLLLAWLYLKRHDEDSRIFTLCLVPMLAGISDYLENIQIVVLLLSYPDISRIQVAFASGATIAKSGLTTLFFLLLLVAFIRLWTGSKPVKK